MKPVDAKLKFQLTKLLQAATAAENGGTVAGVAKPRPEALAARDGSNAHGKSQGKSKGKGKYDDGADDDDADDDDAQDGVYKPLKRSAVMFDDKKASSRAEREARRAKERTEKSQLFKDLLEEYTEAPAEVGHGSDDDDAGVAAALGRKLKQTDADRARWVQKQSMTVRCVGAIVARN